MSTTKKDLRSTLLPYCLRRLPDGSYIALNRDYKPLGFIGCNWVRYEDYPARFRFSRKPPAATIRALSWNGSDDADAVFFYNDGTVPFIGPAADTAAYVQRLTRLARLTVHAVADEERLHLDHLRELMRATVEGLVVSDWWDAKFPEAEAELRLALQLVDERRGQPDALLLVDLHGRELGNMELLPRVKELRAMICGQWHRRCQIDDHVDRVEKAAQLAFCD